MYIDVRDNVLMTVLRHWYRKKKKKMKLTLVNVFAKEL